MKIRIFLLLAVVLLLRTGSPMAHMSPPSDYSIGVWTIKHFESLRLYPYQCSADKWTIGWGRILTKEEVIQYAFTGCTYEEANKWFLEDLEKKVMFVKKVYPRLDGLKKWAMVSLTYNCSVKNLMSSKLHRYIREQRWDDVARQALLWNTANGKPVEGLTKRRSFEGRMWVNNLTQWDYDQLKDNVNMKIQRELKNPEVTKDLIKLRHKLLNDIKDSSVRKSPRT